MGLTITKHSQNGELLLRKYNVTSTKVLLTSFFSLIAILPAQEMSVGAQTHLGAAHTHFGSCYGGFGLAT